MSWPSEPGESEPAVSGFSLQSRNTVALSNKVIRYFGGMHERLEQWKNLKSKEPKEQRNRNNLLSKSRQAKE